MLRNNADADISSLGYLCLNSKISNVFLCFEYLDIIPNESKYL